jgi:hypothetical protein
MSDLPISFADRDPLAVAVASAVDEQVRDITKLPVVEINSQVRNNGYDIPTATLLNVAARIMNDHSDQAMMVTVNRHAAGSTVVWTKYRDKPNGPVVETLEVMKHPMGL